MPKRIVSLLREPWAGFSANNRLCKFVKRFKHWPWRSELTGWGEGRFGRVDAARSERGADEGSPRTAADPRRHSPTFPVRRHPATAPAFRQPSGPAAAPAGRRPHSLHVEARFEKDAEF